MSTSIEPTIVIVCGAWQRITAFYPFAHLLKDRGCAVHCVNVPSTGGTEVPLTGLSEDTKAIRVVLQPLIEQGEEVIPTYALGRRREW